MKEKFCRVAVSFPAKNNILTYSIPDHEIGLKRGDLVIVPLGKRQEKGCVVEVLDELKGDTQLESSFKIKQIVSRFAPELSIPEDQLQFYEWVARYYHYGLGLLIFDSLPKILKRPRKLNYFKCEGNLKGFELNQKQREVEEKISLRIDEGFSKWLLHGVTGSGKTFVYLSLIKKVLERGKSILFLLPEINLTPQFLETFTAYLDVPIFAYNSGISHSDKYGLWRQLQSDYSPKVIVGVRSSIFLPIQNLGLIIVDEEHDPSFKQDDRCPYHARDLALKRGLDLKLPVVLGSATPSVESYFLFKVKDKNHYLTMKERAEKGVLPNIYFEDLREKSEDSKPVWPLTSKSLQLIKEALQRKEQVLIFVNRLGHANYLQCKGCGLRFQCLNCSSVLRYFKAKGELRCVHCEFTKEVPQACPQCQCLNLLPIGFGTERVASLLRELLPEYKIERFDRDEIQTVKALHDRLDNFHAHKIDVLVGTQMLSKGHNFERVNLVIILGMDGQLNFPDFRSEERVYQQITQVSGRSGRFGGEAKVLVQTLNPELPLFHCIQEHSFDGFYHEELKVRELCQCPPYKRLALFIITSKKRDLTMDVSQDLTKKVEELVGSHFPNVSVLGPRPAGVEKKVNQFSWYIILKSDEINQLHNLINTIQYNFPFPSGVSLKVDIDPYSLL